MKSKFRIIVTGLIAQYPLGGVAWDYIQYVLGLHQLGHDVYYLEDTDQWPFNPLEGGLAKDCAYNVKYLQNLMSRFGLENKWAYRFPYESQWFGLKEKDRQDLIRSADVLINVSGTLARPQDYRSVKQLVYIDSDPVFTQVKLARGQNDFRKLIDMHDVHFSFGENFSKEIPDTGHQWLPTRQPVILSEWQVKPPERDVYTTIMNWTSHNDVKFKDKVYGQKDMEFKKFIDLPQKVGKSILELAVNQGKTRQLPNHYLIKKGWIIADPNVVCPDMDTYRQYIQSSKAEWSVAKNGYVLGQSGWFSCRSACYLAAGRPVVVQDTGFSQVLPVGMGILPFKDMEEALSGIKSVEENYEDHSRAARKIAEEYFDSDKVLESLLGRIISKRKVQAT